MSFAEETLLEAACNLDHVTCKLQDGPCRYLRWKGVLDRTLAVLLLIPGLPAIGLLVAIVRLTSRGPGIFCQKRVGKGGRVYTMYKLRSMRIDAEGKTGAVWTKARDPRITWFGKVLRKTHLDELPQLFNVLRGEMSLVGPRPERPEFVSVLAEQVPGYMDRLAVLPGITGLAQINLPPDTDLASVCRKQYLDLQYLHTAACWLDLRILLCTSLRILGVGGFVAMRIARLQRNIPPLDRDASAADQSAADLTPDRLLDAPGDESQEAMAGAEPDELEDELEREAFRQTLTFGTSDTLDDDQMSQLHQQLHQQLRQERGAGSERQTDEPQAAGGNGQVAATSKRELSEKQRKGQKRP